MDSTTDIFSLAERRMVWLDRRQATLAQNVANANTPGYRARDSAPFAAALDQAGVSQAGAPEAGAPQAGAPQVGRLPLLQPSAGHLAGRGAIAGTVVVPGRERTATGNTVSLEDELSKVADTASKQDLTASLFRKYNTLFRTALGR